MQTQTKLHLSDKFRFFLWKERVIRVAICRSSLRQQISESESWRYSWYFNNIYFFWTFCLRDIIQLSLIFVYLNNLNLISTFISSVWRLVNADRKTCYRRAWKMKHGLLVWKIGSVKLMQVRMFQFQFSTIV